MEPQNAELRAKRIFGVDHAILISQGFHVPRAVYLCRAAGIDADYTSWRGEPTSASDEAVLAALHALAGDLDLNLARVDDTRAAEKELRSAESE